MERDIPTVEEIHQIAYLTMHGWEYHSYDNSWTKEGFIGQRWGTPPGCRCGRCNEMIPSKEFDLDDAYWAQQSHDEEVVKEVMQS